MTVKRFVGATARECLRRVKEELGPDAVVISNKQVEQGVEIVAMSPESLDEISRAVPDTAKPAMSRPAAAVPPGLTPVRTEPTLPAAGEIDDYKVTLSAGRKAAATVRPWTPPTATAPAAAAPAAEPSRPPLRPLPPKKNVADDVLSPRQVAATLASVAGEAAGMESSPQVDQLMAEVRVIKSLLERQLAGFAWGEMAREAPVKALLLAELLEAGFSGQLSRRLVDEMPPTLDQDGGRKWLRAAVNRRLRTLPTDSDFIDRGGVYAIVGPTGVGKTTTTAKLAARCVVRYGADRLALLTTDSYRIGAQEQLRIYGRILGVPVYVLRDGDDLRRTLADVRDKHMVLIDTVGMSQRDRNVAEQVAMLTRAGDVNRLLLLNAGARSDTLDDVIRAYSGEDLAGCILTKVDEAPALAPAIDSIVRHGLMLSYVTNGQRVPEDLHLPNRNYLMHRAFKLASADAVNRIHDGNIELSTAIQGTHAWTPAA